MPPATTATSGPKSCPPTPSLFEERGVFDAATGRAFKENILEQGGARDAMALYVDFRGREPTTDALLRHSGIAA